VHEVIHIHPAAPAKPAEGAPCNGCGVCCTSAPCPLGVIASRRFSGPCVALVWADDASLYRCGLLAEPARRLPFGLRWLAPSLARIARRSIAAGSGCDCSMEVVRQDGA
jgi:hypothetical protein